MLARLVFHNHHPVRSMAWADKMSENVGPSSLSTSAQRQQITSRPARKQVSHREVENIRQSQDRSNQSGLTYNIWYGKYAGGEHDDGRKQNVKATTRVNIAKDSGFTRANRNSGEAGYVCLFFARGYCPNGESCTFLHMLPNQPPDQGHDVFGREKFGTSREDMGGIGTIQRVNRTLYVGRIQEEPEQMTNRQQQQQRQPNQNNAKWNGFDKSDRGKGWNKSLPKDRMGATEKVLYRHFSEFGEIDRIRVLYSRGCGFVTFVREIDAQFAKEAMMHQSLDHAECINLRWATDDPNPGAQKRDRHEREQEGLQAIQANISEEARAAGQSLLDLEQEADGYDEEEGQHNGKRVKTIEGGEEDPINEMTEEEYQKLVEENNRNWDEIAREDAELQGKALKEIEEAEELNGNEDAGESNGNEQTNNGFFDKKALDALHALRQKNQSTIPTSITKSALGNLAAYGSDSEEE